MSSQPKILVFNVNWLGDILFSFPALLAIKNHYPSSHLACIVPPPYKDLFHGQSFIDEVIAFSDQTLLDKIRLVSYLRKQNWDISFLFHRSKTRARLLKWAGIPTRIGYDVKHRSHLLTHAISLSSQAQHKMDILRNLLIGFGISNVPSYYEYRVSPGMVSIPKPYIVFHPGSNWKPKQWPTPHFIALGKKLQKQYGVSLVITGSQKDKYSALVIQRELPDKTFDLTGKTTLPELANLFQQSQLVIAGDTGPMHLACASQAHVIALYGPTSPELNGPRGQKNFKVIWEKSNLEKLTPEMVFSTLLNWNIFYEKNSTDSNR